MTDPNPRETELEKKLDDLAERIENMDRPDREIPLPGDEDDDDGVGPITGVVP